MTKKLQIRNSTADFLVFTKENNSADTIEVRVQDGNVWLTPKAIGQLFDIDRSVVTKHLQNVFAVKLRQPGKSEVLAEYSNGKDNLPLVIKTPFGKGAFIYVAGQYGKLLYELEIRHNHRTPYNYRPHPELAALINGIYDYAHKTAKTGDHATKCFVMKYL